MVLCAFWQALAAKAQPMPLRHHHHHHEGACAAGKRRGERGLCGAELQRAGCCCSCITSSWMELVASLAVRVLLKPLGGQSQSCKLRPPSGQPARLQLAAPGAPWGCWLACILQRSAWSRQPVTLGLWGSGNWPPVRMSKSSDDATASPCTAKEKSILTFDPW